MIKIAVTAPRGKMDRLIIKVAAQSSEIEVVGAVGPKGRDYIGMDAGDVAQAGIKTGSPVVDDIRKIIDKCDVVVDFSTRELSMDVLNACRESGTPLICGTTGFDDKEKAAFEEASREIPLMRAANTSYMVQVMQKLLAEAAEYLKDQCKIEIIDMHDEKKKDAPSGTAIEMAEAMAGASGKDISEIEYHSVRAGDIPSSHTVIFGAMGERMEITHHAYNWECYARGACEAVKFMADKDPGMYAMEDVIDRK